MCPNLGFFWVKATPFYSTHTFFGNIYSERLERSYFRKRITIEFSSSVFLHSFSSFSLQIATDLCLKDFEAQQNVSCVHFSDNNETHQFQQLYFCKDNVTKFFSSAWIGRSIEKFKRKILCWLLLKAK